jgi:glycosyltransferase involved in cell wall biosynthesis
MEVAVMEDSKVSVVIPCFNSSKYIESTINSVLDQTYQSIEIILVDDGSTDKTYELLSKYKKWAVILRHPDGANRGQACSVNFGLSKASGQYISILNHDDLWREDNVQLQVTKLKNEPGVGLVYSNGYAIDENGKHLYTIFPPDHKEENSYGKLLMQCYLPSPSAYMIRRTAWDAVGGFDPKMALATDHDLVLRIGEVSKLAYISEHSWYYRIHSEAASITRKREMWESGFDVLRKACSRHRCPLHLKRKRLAVLNFRIGLCMADEQQWMHAVVKFVLSGLLDPMRAFRIITGHEKMPI